LLAMRRAVLSLPFLPELVLVDGRFVPPFPVAARAEIGGDGRIEAIAAASIVAKQARDAIMRRLHATFPCYGFAAHKGYPTAAHRPAIALQGRAPCRRRSFAPLGELVQGGGQWAFSACRPSGTCGFTPNTPWRTASSGSSRCPPRSA